MTVPDSIDPTTWLDEHFATASGCGEARWKHGPIPASRAGLRRALAEAELLACCASRRWARTVAAGRYGDLAALRACAARILDCGADLRSYLRPGGGDGWLAGCC